MLTVRKVAKMLGVTTYTVRNWAHKGKIKAVKIPNNSVGAQWFFDETEIQKLMKGESETERNAENEQA